MVPQNTTQSTEAELTITPDFLGLLSSDFEKLAREAVQSDLQRKLDQGLPVLVWNNGNPYNQYSDDRTEYSPLPVIPKLQS
jgi:hypothetical protein